MKNRLRGVRDDVNEAIKQYKNEILDVNSVSSLEKTEEIPANNLRVEVIEKA